jgi:NAD(P)H-quinone oxidoreductase subunit 5
VEQWRAAHLVHSPRASLWHLIAGAGVVCFAVAPFYAASALPTGHLSPTIGPLAFVLGLSFAPMVGRAIAAGKRAFVIVMLFTAGASAAYFGWHVVFEALAPSINAGAPTSPFKWTIVVIGLVVLFIAQSIMQTSPNGRFAHWLQPHLLSGLYIDDLFTRVTFRLWPPRLG